MRTSMSTIKGCHKSIRISVNLLLLPMFPAAFSGPILSINTFTYTAANFSHRRKILRFGSMMLSTITGLQSNLMQPRAAFSGRLMEQALLYKIVDGVTITEDGFQTRQFLLGARRRMLCRIF